LWLAGSRSRLSPDNNPARRERALTESKSRSLTRSELVSHFAERLQIDRARAREFFDELNALAEQELKRSGEFALPGVVTLLVQSRKARTGRNPATGEAISIPAKTVLKARIAKQLKAAGLGATGEDSAPPAPPAT
jgi:DNA-binding protein HU-beta